MIKNRISKIEKAINDKSISKEVFVCSSDSPKSLIEKARKEGRSVLELPSVLLKKYGIETSY